MTKMLFWDIVGLIGFLVLAFRCGSYFYHRDHFYWKIKLYQKLDELEKAQGGQR
jgi:hypothetical protein